MTKAIIYSRQSKHKDGTISHEHQIGICRAYAAANGLEITEVISEKGKSGRSVSKRPEFQKVIGKMMNGEADVLLVWRFSRFARNTLDGLLVLKEVEEEAGGEVRSAEEPIDKSAMGKFTRSMLLNLAELESDQKSEDWQGYLAHRIGKNLPPAGRRYWGYDRHKSITGEGKDKIVTEWYAPNDHAPLIREGMEKIADGESMRSVAHWLNEKGVTTALGNTIHPNKVRDMYQNPFLRGRIAWKGEEVEGAHEAIISEGLYARFRAQVEEHKLAPRRGVPAHRLVGLVFCSRCGKRMSYIGVRKDRVNSVERFRCATRVAKGAGACEGSPVAVEAVMDALTWWMPRHQQDIEKAAPKQDDLTAKIADRDAEAERLQGKLTETLTIGTQAGLTAAQMADALSSIRGQIEAVKSEAESLRTQVVISQKAFWDIEDTVHGQDVTKARETLKKILAGITHDDDAGTLTFSPTIGTPYTWYLTGGPVRKGGWTE